MSSISLDGSMGCTAIFTSSGPFSLASGWATQGLSQSCPKAGPLISWLCAQSELKSYLEQVLLRDVSGGGDGISLMILQT